MAKKTIGEAKRIYKEYKHYRETERNDFEALVNIFQEYNITREMENHDYFDALSFTDLMFSKTKNTARILSGPGLDGFIDVLEDSFKKMLERTKRVRAIILSSAKPQKIKKLEEKYDNFETQLGKAKGEVSHFIACDSRMLRMETPHEKLTEETPADVINADVYFSNEKRAKMTEERFDHIWHYLKS